MNAIHSPNPLIAAPSPFKEETAERLYCSTETPHESFPRQLDKFFKEAHQLANQFLAPKNLPYTGDVVIRNHYYYHYTPFYTPWYVSRPVIYHPGGCNRRNQENNDGASLLIGLIASIGLIFASYAIGSAIASYRDAKEELEKTKDFKRDLREYQNWIETTKPVDLQDWIERPKPTAIQEIKEAVKLKEKICSRIQNSSAWDLALRVTLAVGLASNALGAFIAAPPLLVLGVALTIASTAAICLKWGIESGDSNKRDAFFLKATLEIAKESMQNEKMRRKEGF